MTHSTSAFLNIVSIWPVKIWKLPQSSVFLIWTIISNCPQKRVLLFLKYSRVHLLIRFLSTARLYCFFRIEVATRLGPWVGNKKRQTPPRVSRRPFLKTLLISICLEILFPRGNLKDGNLNSEALAALLASVGQDLSSWRRRGTA